MSLSTGTARSFPVGAEEREGADLQRAPAPGSLLDTSRRPGRAPRWLILGDPGSATTEPAVAPRELSVTLGAGAVRPLRAHPLHLPFRDGVLDAVVCGLDPEALRAGHDRLLVWELARVLAPGGALVWVAAGPAPPVTAAGPRSPAWVRAAQRCFEAAGEPLSAPAGAEGPAAWHPMPIVNGASAGSRRVAAVLRRCDVTSPPGAGEVVGAWLEAAAAPPPGRPPAGAVPRSEMPALLARLAEQDEAQRRAVDDLAARLDAFEDRLRSELRPWRTARAVARRVLNPRLVRYRQYSPRPIRIPAWYRASAPAGPWPSVSVVTPCRNAARYLERTLRSVVDQEYPGLEYIVQDGASTDGTLAILERYRGRLASVESEPDTGQADALGRGFRRSTGEILAYLNADDLLLPGALPYVAAYFRMHPEVDVVYGHRVVVDERDREIGRWVLPPHDPEVLSWADWIPQETLFWRRRIWERAGAFVDPTFQFAMDWDLLVRFRDAGARFVRLPRFLGAFRAHDEQKSSRQLRSVGDREMRRIRQRIHGAPVSDAEVSRRVRRYLLRHVVYDRLYRVGLVRY
jgi:glycosyltransferase involved in cell wall biosynthesis/SAM-dependent methyltransferase